MGSFVTGTEIDVIQDENWEPWESVTIREYDQGAKDAMGKEIVEMAGLVGQVPRIVMQSALVPVLEAGIRSWTLRNLSDEAVRKLYETQAKALGKGVTSLSAEDKGETVKAVPIVPVTREWMAKLKPSYANFIVQEIRRLNRGRTSAEERDFLRRLGYGDTDERETAGGGDAD